jgi:hypothetical protein
MRRRPGAAALILAACLVTVLATARATQGQARVFYVATTGSDTTGDGSFDQPWASLNHALAEVPDEISTVVVGDGSFDAPVLANRAFTTQTTVRAENAYGTRLVARAEPVLTVAGGTNLTFTGFEITRPANDNTGLPLVWVTDRLGRPASRVSIRSNIIHDAARSHLVAVDSGSQDLLIESNVLYNPGDGLSHLVLDGTDGALVRENVLFDDFVAAGRAGDASASFLVISNIEGVRGRQERLLSRDLIVDRNIFLGWQGVSDAHFVRLGGSGVPGREVDGLRLESNLFLGDSRAALAAPLGVLGARAVSARANTIVGNLPSLAFVAEMDRRGNGTGNEDISFYNNLWSDPTGTMSGLSVGDPAANALVVSANNLYWNGGRAIPEGSGVLSVNADPSALVDDPQLPATAGVVPPRWDAIRRQFSGGHETFREAFTALALYALTAEDSPAIDHADAEHMPLIDLLGRPRGSPDIGALEHRSVPTATPVPPGAGKALLPLLMRGRR